jgi:hypothetical protein
MDGFPSKLTDSLKDTSFNNITQVIVDHCDGISVASEELTSDLQTIFDNSSAHKIGLIAEDMLSKELSAFIDKVVNEPVLA